MKVLQLVMSRQYRGAEIFSLQLTRQLMEIKVSVKWVTLYPPFLDTALPVEGVDCVELMGQPNKFVDWSLLKRFRDVVQSFQPNIVQANAGDTLKYAWLAKKIFGLHYKLIFRNASTVSLYLKSPLQKWFYSILYRDVDRIISVSHFSKNDFVNTFPMVKNKIEVIPIGISTDVKLVRLKMFDNNRFNLLHLAGFTFEKNHEGLLKIFFKVKEKIPTAKLWLVGDGPLRNKIEEEVKIKQLVNDIEFTGSVTDPLNYIRSADVLVLPSLVEGLPAVILEAMYCQTPVIAYNVGGISEVVKNGETGWLVSKGDEDGFAEAVLHAIDNGNSIRQIKENAYQLVATNYDNKVIAKRFLESYRQLIK